MRINFADIEQRVEQILRGWETTAPDQPVCGNDAGTVQAGAAAIFRGEDGIS